MALNNVNSFTREAEYVDELTKQRGILDGEPELEFSLTQACLQRMFSAAYYFPCCPNGIATNHIEMYFKKLKVGAIFAYNENSPKLIIVEFMKIMSGSSILIMCEREGRMYDEIFKPWSIFMVTFRNGFFIHSNLGSYFDKVDADKAFCIQRLEK